MNNKSYISNSISLRKLFLYVFSILLLIIITGCSNNPINDGTVCQNSCSNLDAAKDYIETHFGFAPESYTVECIQCNMTRGGYVKARIIKDGSPIDLSYDWGWCSSGGTDCGWSMCFKSVLSENDSNNNLLYQGLKNTFCNKLYSMNVNDGQICTLDAYDNSTFIRIGCMNGNYELINDAYRTISIIQTANRCSSSVSVGEFDCIK